MTNQTEQIASVHVDFDDKASALTALLDVVALRDDLTLVSEGSNHVVLTGPDDVIAQMVTHFDGRIQFEPNQPLTSTVPGPFQDQEVQSNSDAGDDDKDDDEVHFF